MNEVHELAQELYNDPAIYPGLVKAVAEARRLLPELHDFARQWDAAQARERAVVEGWGSAFEADADEANTLRR
jgi:hypothetical protein